MNANENSSDSFCFQLPQEEKEIVMFERMQYLTQWHYERCAEYRSIIDAYGGLNKLQTLEDMPFVAARLFKLFELKSVDSQDVVKVLRSSGTRSQVTSKIYLDQETSSQQAKALVKTLQSFIGKQRLPMLFIDHNELTANHHSYSARGAGVQGLSLFGRNHTYVLDKNMSFDLETFLGFCEQYAQQPVLLFGFTFMVWQYLLKELERNNVQVNLPQGILIHSGGWKKMHDQAVDNATFKQQIKAHLGISKVHNFYGMVEQTGSIFMECEQGVLHASDYNDVIFRHTHNWQPCEVGEQGLIQVFSTLPTSYPGHNLLTEDLGTLLGVDDCPCGRSGSYFTVDGRLTQAEQRGCSDTHE